MTTEGSQQRESTLQSTLNGIMLVTMGLVAIVAIGGLFAYSQIKQTLAEKALEDTLTRSAPAQVEAILPSFLLPEQRTGAALFLQRYRQAEQLSEIQILATPTDLPSEFGACNIDQGRTTCFSRDRTQIGLIYPVQESGKILGYFFKAKRISNPFVNDHLLVLIEFATAILIFAFLILFLLVSKLTTRQVPGDLSNLVSWVEDVLRGQTATTAPKLKFRELNELGSKIAQVLDRYEKERDQAIVGQLTSGIMHDIKTPLHSIVTAQHLVAEQPLQSPKRPKLLENLYKVCTAKLPVIGDIIESTLDGNRAIHIDQRPEDLRNTIEQSIAIHSQGLAQRNARLDFVAGADPIIVEHDPVQLGRVFSNILKNSIEALDQPTASRNALSDIRIAVQSNDNGQISVAIEDAGPGLPDNPESVFRIFRSSKPRGTGLGLMISRKIVEAHRGQMTATRSTILPGARFEISLPRSALQVAPLLKEGV